jgi:hypothetical protein
MSLFAKQLDEKRELRRAVMMYFDAPNRARDMENDPSLKMFERKDIKNMMYALDRVGLIAKISGTGPGAGYITTDDGVILMKAMDMSVEIIQEE